jgi:aminoglycoside phosphotransferase (APT) family kinase protein
MPAKPIDDADLQARAQTVLSASHPGSNLGPIHRLQGGTSSITYRATLTVPGGSPEEVVLKVAPAGLAPVRNRDVLRQARLQRALQSTGVPVPAVLAEHEGDPPDFPPFFVMSFVDGACVEPSALQGNERLPPEEVRERMLDAARILGVLHSLSPEELGLAAGEASVSPAAELDRWVQSLAACDEDLQMAEDVRDRLLDTVPPARQVALIHGDFRVGNTLSAGDRVLAVIDWEIWALGDPRVDLAWFLMACNPDEKLNRTVAAGAPTDHELILAYEKAGGGPVEDLAWFAALTRYKQLAITALLVRNARRRGEQTAMMGALPALTDSARAMLGLSG